jgi:hypothetical protein
MIILPKERPVLKKLNSYYIRLHKLVEHCQGEFGSGIIHFYSPTAEGMVFFDKDEILNGVFVSNKAEKQGQQALDLLLGSDDYNFTINVYQVALELIDFWAQMPKAEIIYKDLSTEFTDFEVLFNKMKSEKLTGFFNISLNNDEGSALYFLSNGEVVGGSYSWQIFGGLGAKENHELLVTTLKTGGGTFDVIKIPSGKTSAENKIKVSGEKQTSVNVLVLLEEFLSIVEKEVLAHTKIKKDFSLLLKNKFVQKANKYPFLDPFAAEFEYADRKITYSGVSTDKEVVCGVIESVKELVEELGVLFQVMDASGAWRQKYEKVIRDYKIEF